MDNAQALKRGDQGGKKGRPICGCGQHIELHGSAVVRLGNQPGLPGYARGECCIEGEMKNDHKEKPYTEFGTVAGGPINRTAGEKTIGKPCG